MEVERSESNGRGGSGAEAEQEGDSADIQASTGGREEGDPGDNQDVGGGGGGSSSLQEEKGEELTEKQDESVSTGNVAVMVLHSRLFPRQ